MARRCDRVWDCGSAQFRERHSCRRGRCARRPECVVVEWPNRRKCEPAKMREASDVRARQARSAALALDSDLMQQWSGITKRPKEPMCSLVLDTDAQPEHDC